MRQSRDSGDFCEQGLKVNHGKTQVTVSGSKVDSCGVSSLRVKTNSVLCLQCGKWIHLRYIGVKRVTHKSYMHKM